MKLYLEMGMWLYFDTEFDGYCFDKTKYAGIHMHTQFNSLRPSDVYMRKIKLLVELLQPATRPSKGPPGRLKVIG